MIQLRFHRALSLGLGLCAASAMAMSFVGPAQAQAGGVTYRSLTAKELMSGIDEGTLAAQTPDPAVQRQVSTARATAYMLGVADSTSGRQWCPPSNLSITDLAATVYGYLAKLPDADLAKPAAATVGHALSVGYPCKR